ncbi:chemotaxis protein CheW [Niveispirillum irakense]|uniref:chemotaxis protein CheW n=1 Tax=Niveispirillum irakense TaxID=34011 RepID=UPI0003F6AEB7|nr:chemotaxis protein CheW [Niveispirillum irakense]
MSDFRHQHDDTQVALLLFQLDGRAYALRLDRVERVTASVAVTPLPAAPPVVMGVIDVAGQIVPMFDLRQRFGLPSRQPRLDDALVIVQASSRLVALLVDHVDGTIHRDPEDLRPTDGIVPGTRYFDAVMSLPDGPVFIHDIDRFLSMEEERELDVAMGAAR